jgi:hypothetical protein
MLELYGRVYRGWNVKHFHYHGARSWFPVGLHVGEDAPAHGRSCGARQTTGAHRRKREHKPSEGMMLHQDGSRAARLEGQSAPRSDRDDGGRQQHDLLGGRHRPPGRRDPARAERRVGGPTRPLHEPETIPDLSDDPAPGNRQLTCPAQAGDRGDLPQLAPRPRDTIHCRRRGLPDYSANYGFADNPGRAILRI